MLCIGYMSGTSMDGLDAVLIETDGQQAITVLDTASMHYSPDFQQRLKKCEQLAHDILQPTSKQDIIDDLHKRCDLNALIREFTQNHLHLTQALLNNSGKQPHDIDALGFHGQTILHRPDLSITVQIGDPQWLHEQTGITVIHDFRHNDILHGGQGAPFAPLYHQARVDAACVVVNCGGIANITVIMDEKPEQLIAFDTGPGNTLIDRFVQEIKGQPCDLDGAFGAQGAIIPELQQALLQNSCKRDPQYFQKSPPKSLDALDFALIDACFDYPFHDVCKTLEDFTAKTIVDSLSLCKIDKSALPNTWILAGGGWHNPVIKASLAHYIEQYYQRDVTIKTADDMGWDNATFEAQIFAYFAARRLLNLPISFPNTTGVKQACIGGDIIRG